MKIDLGGIISNSTIDYPGKPCAVVFLYGCPFRCQWCQNPELVAGNNYKKIEIGEIVKQLKENFLIDAVCITGGEPLMQANTIELLRRIKKETNLLLKIDHNGYFPERVEKALKYLDCLATDIKAPLNEKYGKVVGLPDKWKIIVEKIKKTHKILRKWNGRKTARTTIVPGLIDSADDIQRISEIVKENKFNLYTLQQFRNDKALDKSFEKKEPPSCKKMLELGRAAKKILGDIKVQTATSKNGFEEIIL